MGDTYNRVYHPLLAKYQPDEQVNAQEIMLRTLARLPIDQVPAVFLYQGNFSTLRVVHHIHYVEATFGHPITPLTNTYLGITGDVYNGNVQLVQLAADSFYSTARNIVVPTIPAITALLAASPNGMIGPFERNNPDTEVISSLRAVPVPYAYVPLLAFRTLSPMEAWQQVGEQILLDGRQEDCLIFLNFLRAATVERVGVRGGIRRNVANLPPVLTQIVVPAPPQDGPILEHAHRKLRQLLPALYVQPIPAIAYPAAQAAVIMNQTVAEGFEALRADRLLEQEAAAVPKTFSEMFPANAVCIHCLCLVGDDDDRLPEFWQFWASVKGKKAAGLAAFTSFVTRQANNQISAEVVPVVSTALWVNISSFDLGAADPEVITQGISPFLMCPRSSKKANATTVLTQKYLLLQGGANLPLLSDIHQLVPTSDYNIPEDIHALGDYIRAYSIIWDVLIGEQHPLSIALRHHFKFWKKHGPAVITAIPESFMRNVVIIGTLRFIQLTVMRYVNEIMYAAEDDFIMPPSFDHIVTSIQNRLFQQLPALPASYHAEPKAAPMSNRNATPNSTNRLSTTPVGNEVVAPDNEKVTAYLDAFKGSQKTIPQLRNIAKQPKVKNGTTTLCLSYHLRGSCFDNCRRIDTQRKLVKVEEDHLATFIRDNL
jgi:hypothetical protein